MSAKVSTCCKICVICVTRNFLYFIRNRNSFELRFLPKCIALFWSVLMEPSTSGSPGSSARMSLTPSRSLQFQATYNDLEHWLADSGGQYPKQHVDDKHEERLARWINNRRGDYTKGLLSSEHMKALESLPGWQWSTFEDQWQNDMDSLRKWLLASEGKFPCQHSPDHSENHLARWMNHQRLAKDRGEMSIKRARCLEELPGWSWAPRQASWEEDFARLNAWLCNPPYSHQHPRHYPRSGGLRCGADAGRGESSDQSVATQLDKSRLKSDFKSYLEVDCSQGLSARSSEEERLARWVLRQLWSYRDGKMSSERACHLMQLPNWLWPLLPGQLEVDWAWDHQFQKLQEWPTHPLSQQRRNYLGTDRPLGPSPWAAGPQYERQLYDWYFDNFRQMRSAAYPGSSPEKSGWGSQPVVPRMPWHRIERFLPYVREFDCAHIHGEGAFHELLIKVDSNLISRGLHKKGHNTIGCYCCVPEFHGPKPYRWHWGADTRYIAQFEMHDGIWRCVYPDFPLRVWTTDKPKAKDVIEMLGSMSKDAHSDNPRLAVVDLDDKQT